MAIKEKNRTELTFTPFVVMPLSRTSLIVNGTNNFPPATAKAINAVSEIPARNSGDALKPLLRTLRAPTSSIPSNSFVSVSNSFPIASCPSKNVIALCPRMRLRDWRNHQFLITHRENRKRKLSRRQ